MAVIGMLFQVCYFSCVVTGMRRERDELVALLNTRERQCFETLSLVGQTADGDDSGKQCKDTSDPSANSNVTAVKVCFISSLS